MIRHVVVAGARTGATDAALDDIVAEWARLRELIPEIVTLTVGRDLGLGTRRIAVAAVSDFASPEAWRRFMDHPAHVAFRDAAARVLDRDTMAVTQFEL